MLKLRRGREPDQDQFSDSARVKLRFLATWPEMNYPCNSEDFAKKSASY